MMDLLNRIKSEVKKADPKSDVILFGSKARGDNRAGSDWDILILVDDAVVTNDVDDKFRDRLYDIELDSGEIISILIYPRQYWETQLKYSPLYNNISREGKWL